MIVKQMYEQPTEAIFKRFVNHQQEPLDYYGLQKSDVVSYINTLKNCYQKIHEDDFPKLQ